MQDRAQTVIVGAGIVGASAAYHLAELGQADVLVIDRGPLFETGGSTSHAPGLAFQTNGSRTMCRIAQDSVRLYSELDVDGEPCWYGVGGIEVATSEARMAELHRRRGWARSYGIEDTELLTPEQTAERIPLLDPSTILGSYLVPSDGIANGVRIATALARRAGEKGVSFEGEVAVTGFDVAEGRVRAVLTDHGRIECERVLICAGIWGPTVGAMAGVPIPLLAVQHQLVWTDPIEELRGETREIVHPILRHQDFAMYFRQRGDHYGVGSYYHEPIATVQSELPAPGGDLQPALMP
ncbi:MAG TPA: FAD-binding oxidoreductase, partial [Actinomycetota bacterium]|nr:FAD-binding oxidoreductase [Actinomycetota bacterium]